MSRKKKKTLEELLEEALVPEEEQPYQVPENWVWVRLGKCINKLQYGYTQSATSKPVGPKFLRITDIQNGTVDWSTVPFCEINDLDFIKYKLYPNDIVVARTGATTGKSYLIENPENAVFASYLIRLSPSHILESRYLWLFMKSNCYWRQITTVSKGIAQPGVNATVLGNLAIPLPPRQEQKRIVARVESLLGKINEAKVLIEEAKETFESRRAAILAKAFRGELTKKWREQNPDIEPADQLLERIKAEKEKLKGTKKRRKQTELPPIDPPYELPKGWTWVRLENLVESTVYGTSAKANDNPNGVPVLRMGNIQDGEIDTKNLKYLPSDHPDVQKYDLEEDDLLFNRTNSYELVGKTAIVRNIHAGKMTFASYLVRVRLFERELLSEYICKYINSFQGRKLLLSTVTQQVGQANINAKKLLMLPIPLPPERELKVIISILNKLFDVEKELYGHLEIVNLNSLTQSILNKAFRGELGTNDPEEESASELLKEVLSEQTGEKTDDPKSKFSRQGTLLQV